ncbi:MAG TPA: hypothetical protein VK196_10780 [Magnetospirillum sp.]|nr:hypothetical protein [Magnetospirillum sp.]
MGADTAATGHRSPAFAVLGIAALGALIWLLALGVPTSHAVAVNDSDSWMHVVRLLEILERGAWNHGITLRDGAPTGYALHWSMPLDLLVLGAAAPLAASQGWEAAIRAIAPYVGAITGILLIVAMAWAILPAGRLAAGLAVIFTATALPVLGYGRLGVCDHHLLIEAVSVAAVAAAWRASGNGARAGLGALTGVLGGLCLWTALEAAPAALLAGMVVILPAILAPERYRPMAAAYAVALPATTLLALAIDRPADLATTDRLGPVIALLAVLGGATVVVALLPAVTRLSLLRRFVAVGVFAVIGGALWIAAFLLCKRLSPGLTDPAVAAWHWGDIAEMTSPLRLGVGMAVALLTQPILAMIAAALLAWRSGGRERLLWAAALAIMLILFAGGLVAARLTLHAAVPSAAILAIALARLKSLRLLLPLAVVGLPFLLPAIIGTVPAQSSGNCVLAEASRVLAAEPGAVVLADVNLSPELLYLTRTVRTVSGTYHVNARGLGDLYHFNAAATDAAAKTIADRIGATHVLACSSGGMPASPFRDRLFNGQHPDWLIPLPLTAPESGPMRLFRIVR